LFIIHVLLSRNLDAFQDGVETALDHHLKIDSSRVLHLDGNAVPTGEFDQAAGTPFDFRQEQKIGARWNATQDLCGLGEFIPFKSAPHAHTCPFQDARAMTIVGFMIAMRVIVPEHLFGVINLVLGE